MQQLIYFIQRYRYVLYFLLLQLLSLLLIINNHSYHKSKFISSANSISGGVFEKRKSITDYLNLKTENKLLIQENLLLKNKITFLQSKIDTAKTYTQIDSIEYQQQYKYIDGIITKNEYHKAYNYLTINRGKKNGITSEMAVINHLGVIGVTDAVSNSYARVRSILNRSNELSVRLKNKDINGNYYYGSLSWDTKDYQIVQLNDIPRQATISIGDTIVTSGRSAIFPEGILVGSVKSTELRQKSNTIEVQLFNDMTSLRNIYVINNFHKQEIKELEQLTNE
ncbi:rod shape-determining protein MreC [Tenacibaculum skagerrakense]|uniref:Cell shape-determining protein MreC n=1 Tax=Tenacibaculum skagerrakense TaxID=186571 RepID=A0A4R2NQU3_9FLAO|nr:rod shape-determining protein MreC [Tenacibaculum skagerrakense]TCP23695.1 rod shape-determining protein MreC [Tenacibaculum skagerrakense]